MFLKYFAPLYEPIKWVRNKWIKGTTAYGRVRVDVSRVKSYKNLAKSKARDAKYQAKQAKQKAKAAKAKAKSWKQGGQQQPAQLGPGGPMGQPQPAMAGGGGAAYAGGGGGGYAAGAQGGAGYGPQVAPNPAARYAAGQPGGAPHMGGNGAAGGAGRMGGPGAGPGAAPGPGGPGAVNGVNGASGIVVSGALWWKKHLCANCGQQLDKTWDVCPYCSQAGGPPVSPKTQAIMVDSAGQGSGMQLLGWLVPIKGANRGELFTLAPMTSIGSDPTCTVVINDQYMSARHAEIKAEGGNWVLRDLRSTNGTYVNDKRVEQHELVDNDFVRVGQCVLKFKSL
jgi:pSer/pThr/pTyr-binding forkhead associated (FHA) protein